MKLLNKWINHVPPELRDAYRALSDIPAIACPLNLGGKFAFLNPTESQALAACPPSIQPGAWLDFVRHIGSRSNGLLEAWALSGVFMGGFKTYAPTANEFEALSRVEVRIPWSEYRQPFSVMTVAIPEGVFAPPISSDVGEPAAIIARHEPKTNLFSLVLVSNDFGGVPAASLTSQHAPRPDDNRSMEEVIGELPSEDVTQDESSVIAKCLRVAINANLLLTNKGAKRIGAANPDYEAKLRKSLDKKNLPDSVRKANERSLRELPIVYGFEQHVRVYEQEPGSGAGGEGGHNVRPHWRRGHWAHQRHGPAGSLRKLIFRPAVMVNAAQFGGELSDTKAVYTTAGSGA